MARKNPKDAASGGTGDKPVSTTNLQSTVKRAANKLAKALENASELKVETRYVLTDVSGEAGSDERGHLLARTIMQADGDTELVIPMERSDDGLTTNREIFDLHMSNVKTALDYRGTLLESLLKATRSLS